MLVALVVPRMLVCISILTMQEMCSRTPVSTK